MTLGMKSRVDTRQRVVNGLGCWAKRTLVLVLVLSVLFIGIAGLFLGVSFALITLGVPEEVATLVVTIVMAAGAASAM